MKDKKGLILEIVAIVCVITLIIMLVLPRIKKNSYKNMTFENKIKVYYKLANKNKKEKKIFNNTGVKDSYQLEVDENVLLQYYIEINDSKKIIVFKLTDGTNKIEFENSDGIKLSDLSKIEQGTYVMDDAGKINNKITSNEKPVSFEKDSWNTIVATIESGEEIPYYLGDTKEIKLNSYTNNGVKVDERTVTVRLVNTNTTNFCEEKNFNQSACGYVIEFVDVIDLYNYDKSSDNEYNNSEINKFLDEVLFNALPSDLQNVIKLTHISISDYDKNAVVNAKLYLPSVAEMYANGPSLKVTEYDNPSKTRQLDYYMINTEDSKKIKKYNNKKVNWWLRSTYVSSENKNLVASISTDGKIKGVSSSEKYGVSPLFRIG